MPNKYLSIDTETGGLGMDTSLLSFALVIADEDFQITQEKHVKVKPDDGIYRVTAVALNVNRINLLDHDKEAITFSKAKTELYMFLQEHSNYGKNKLYVIGKQVAGDIARMHQLVSKGNFEQFTSYRYVDVSSITIFLKSIGLLQGLEGDGLSDLIKYYDLDNCYNLGPHQHDAMYDAKATLYAYCRMVLDTGAKIDV